MMTMGNTQRPVLIREMAILYMKMREKFKNLKMMNLVVVLLERHLSTRTNQKMMIQNVMVVMSIPDHNHILEEAGSSGSSSDNRRMTIMVSLVSSQKFGSLSALDAGPGSVSKQLSGELEEGEISVSGDSRVDHQQSGSWIHDREEGCSCRRCCSTFQRELGWQSYQCKWEFSADSKMSGVQRRCKNVISRLRRKIDKEGQQIVPLLTDLWKRIENSGFMTGSENNTLDLRKIEMRVDKLEYNGVMELVFDMKVMLNGAMQFYGFSHEIFIVSSTWAMLDWTMSEVQGDLPPYSWFTAARPPCFCHHDHPCPSQHNSLCLHFHRLSITTTSTTKGYVWGGDFWVCDASSNMDNKPSHKWAIVCNTLTSPHVT